MNEDDNYAIEIFLSTVDPENFFRCWSVDSLGNRVLVGLSIDETLEWARNHPSINGHKDREKFIKIDEKHQLARLSVIGAEIDVRNGATVN